MKIAEKLGAQIVCPIFFAIGVITDNVENEASQRRTMNYTQLNILQCTCK